MRREQKKFARRGERGGTYHLHALHCEERVFVGAWATQDGLAVDDADLARVREEHPYGVEGNDKEVPEEQERRLLDAVEGVSGDSGSKEGGRTRRAG